MTTWFSSDFHLDHHNIIKSCNRPFSSVHDMNEVIINNINELVDENDTLWFLGDFTFRRANSIAQHRNKIKCKHIHLIYGNHDEKFISKHFETARDYAKIKIEEQKIILFHYPIAVWDCKHYGSWNLCGHSHGNYPPSLPNNTTNGLCLDVGVDVHDFKPLSFEQVKIIMTNKQKMMNIVQQIE